MNQAQDKASRELHTIRDTIESIWVAIVLAFVLRAFFVEAFVIPTGSMAPRLLGEHWDLRCPACGYEYSYGRPRKAGTKALRTGDRKLTAICPNCGCPYNTSELDNLSNSGDRVLVLKYLYRLSGLGLCRPRPWDVIVFRNPQNNHENYIKRLIGLPGETIEIVHGDIFVADKPDGPRRIRRKPPRVQEAMWQIIYDNDYPPDEQMLYKENITRRRWELGTGWSLEGYEGRAFAFAGGGPGQMRFEADVDVFKPHYGYNDPTKESGEIDDDLNVCSDLKLAFVFVPKARDAKVSLMLSSFDNFFRGDVGADGAVELWYRSPSRTDNKWLRWAPTDKRAGKIPPLEINRGCQVALTHVDMRVTLWVDGEAVLQSSDDKYPEDYRTLTARMPADRTEPVPAPQAAIAARGGACELRHVRLWRDVYYTQPKRVFSNIPAGPYGRFARDMYKNKIKSDRPGWGTAGYAITLKEYPDNPALDQFFVLGDNSPQSLDGRSWTSASPTLRLRDANGKALYQLGTVPRYNLIGKAIFVYWPSGFRLPGVAGLPVIPNFGRMRLIR